VNQQVRAWLERSRPAGEEPLFLYVHYLDPHPPLLSGGIPIGQTPRRMRRAYDRELQRVDRALGELIEELDTLLGEPRVFFVTSDHGEEFGEHGEGGHGHSLYREVTHIPAVLHTGRDQHVAIPSPLEGRDFHDLLLALADAPGLDVAGWSSQRGRSVRYSSIYSTGQPSFHRPYIANVCMRALEKDGWLVLWSAYGPSLRLYDAKRDPGQHRDRSREEPEIAARLEREMREVEGREWAHRERVQFRQQTQDQLRALGYIE
jgi:arylsulfatase A-like enzyme